MSEHHAGDGAAAAAHHQQQQPPGELGGCERQELPASEIAEMPADGQQYGWFGTKNKNGQGLVEVESGEPAVAELGGGEGRKVDGARTQWG